VAVVTAHAGPPPVPARITMALDAAGLWGPEVDVALGGVEPMVDEWEAGTRLPTREQVERLAELTTMPVAYFYTPAEEWESRPTRTFICERNRRPENRLTIVESHIDWDGVLHRQELTPPKPPYRPRTRTPEAPVPARRTTRTGRAPARPHLPEPSQETPGVCAHCPLPVDARNARHITPQQLPAASDDPQSRAAGENRGDA
jgi:hypothetical protein